MITREQLIKLGELQACYDITADYEALNAIASVLSILYINWDDSIIAKAREEYMNKYTQDLAKYDEENY